MKLAALQFGRLPEVTMRHAADVSESDGADGNGQENLADTHVHGESGRGYTQRFTLPSGSRPLAGYTIKRGVGVGGFGEVYYATTDAGKDVALKKIQRNLDIELRGVRQCLNIKHPNLLSLYDIRYDDEGQAWVVMEFVSGDNLQVLIEQHPQGMPQDQVRLWWDGIAAGVGHLHDCGIVHRDLKPGNIFLDGSTVKIGDYGLSKFISCSRRSGQTQSVGTFHYMAPEIGQGRYGKEIDIYALGIILYEMLTGRVPYDGESSQEIIMKHLTAAPPVHDLVSPFREVVAKSLAKDPEARFRSVAEMQSALAWEVNAKAPNSGQAAASATRMPENPFVMPSAFAPVAAPSNPAAAASPGGSGPLADEPVARAVIAAWKEMTLGWRNIDPKVQMGLLIGAAVLVYVNSRLFVSITGAVLVYYVLYLAIRAFLIGKAPPTAATASSLAPLATPIASEGPARVSDPIATTTPPARRQPLPRVPKLSHKRVREALGKQPAGKRLADVTTSLLLASVVIPVLSFAASLLVLQATGSHTVEVVSNFLWLTISGTVATWGVLLASKPWDSLDDDQFMRRLGMLAVGFSAGLVSFGVAHLMKFQPPDILEIDGMSPSSFHDAQGTPLIWAYLAYFGGLFFVLRWWRLADPLRRNRLSLMSTGGMILAAIVLQAFCNIPQGFLVAASSALAVQVAAPWLHPDRRRELQDQLQVTA